MQTADGNSEVAFFNSPDSTRLACYHDGTGPPLVLVYGALADQTYWRASVPFLRGHFSLHMLERRGRGVSGDTQPYSVDREGEDVVAAIDAVGEPCNVFGHSSGAILALLAALQSTAVRRLILYEPPVLPMADRLQPHPDLHERLVSLLAKGDRALAAETFLREGPGASDQEIERLKGSSRWQEYLALAPTTAYDAQIVTGFRQSEPPYDRLATSTELIVGGASPKEWLAGVQLLAKSLPSPHLSILEGEGHGAVYTAPETLAKLIIDFCA